MTIDTLTMFVMICIISTVLAIAVGLIARPDEPEGTGYWSLALLLNSTAYVLYILRGHISDWISIVLANVALSGAFAAFLMGVLQFQRRTLPKKLIFAPVVLEAILFVWLIDAQNGRHIANAITLPGQMFWIVGLMLQQRHTTTGRGQYFVITGFLGLIATLINQGVSAFLNLHSISTIWMQSPAQTMVFLLAPVFTILISLGLVVMTKERTDERNRTLATRDELTGLFNRRAILESLAHHLTLAKRGLQPLSLLMVDIDFFKRVNDTYGHPSGDKVLSTMAALLSQHVREQDLVGRVGGEEFLIVLPNTPLEGAIRLAETLRMQVANTEFHCVDGLAIHITASFGACGLDMDKPQDGSELVNQADQALYKAKHSGRNRVDRYEPEGSAASTAERGGE